MKNISIFIWAIFASFMLSSCLGEEEEPVEPAYDYWSVFNFQDGSNAWEGGFAGYPIEDSALYALDTGHVEVPNGSFEGIFNENAYRLSGKSVNENLFFYFKKEIEGLEPTTNYALTFNYRIGFQVLTDSLDTLAGKNLYVRAGAVPEEPMATPGNNNLMELNLNAGSGLDDGDDMAYLGRITIGDTDFVRQVFLVESQEDVIEVTSNSEGKLWLVLGIDSEVPDTVNVFYSGVAVYYDELESVGTSGQ